MTEPKNLHAFADGELGDAEVKALRETLKIDARAAEELNAILNLKDILAKNSIRHSDDEVWRGCVRRLDAIDKSRRVEGFVGRYAWALCGFLFLFILTGRFAMRNVEGATTNTADLSRLFVGNRPISPAVKQEARAYDQLLGDVRSTLNRESIEVFPPMVGNFQDFPAARYLLRDRQGDMTLLQVDGALNLQDTSPIPSNPNLAAGVMNNQNCVVWQMEGRTWLLAGDRAMKDLTSVANKLLGQP